MGWIGGEGLKVLKMSKAEHLPLPARARISFNNLQLRERNDLLLQCSLAAKAAQIRLKAACLVPDEGAVKPEPMDTSQ